MKQLDIKLLQDCPHCHKNTLEFVHWYIGPRAQEAMAFFKCNNYLSCGERYYRFIDITMNELIVKE